MSVRSDPVVAESTWKRHGSATSTPHRPIKKKATALCCVHFFRSFSNRLILHMIHMKETKEIGQCLDKHLSLRVAKIVSGPPRRPASKGKSTPFKSKLKVVCTLLTGGRLRVGSKRISLAVIERDDDVLQSMKTHLINCVSKISSLLT